jgi:hypothetical protein
MATKFATLDRAHARTVINNFLDQFQNLCNTTGTLRTTELEKWMSRNIEFSSNGQVVCHNSAEYIAHLDKYREAYSSLEIINLLDDTLVADNKAIANYDVHLIDRKTKKLIKVNVIVIATIEDSKITRWNQVANEKGSSTL